MDGWMDWTDNGDGGRKESFEALIMSTHYGLINPGFGVCSSTMEVYRD
jgi:hypothetical protein